MSKSVTYQTTSFLKITGLCRLRFLSQNKNSFCGSYGTDSQGNPLSPVLGVLGGTGKVIQ
ncbi:hypothetical protein [Streptomyces sp. NPDC001594]|uniref:hypothetical protein n=1 Tax=Streptomyces sp. NPDC001594 TaxID=3364590 RepID=UPI0036C03D67